MIATILVFISAPARAQSISGTLVDGSSGEPLADASVLLLDADSAVLSQTTTDTLGAWSLRVPEWSARYFVRVRKVGYATIETALFRLVDAPISMRLTTRPEVVSLPELSSQQLTYEGILSRRERRMGYIIGPDEIAARIARLGPHDMNGLLKGLLPGMDVNPRTHGLLIPRHAGRRGCSPMIIVDGKWYRRPPKWPPWNIDALVALWEIRAIEIYQDPRFIPKELNLRHTILQACGAIFLWTYRGVGWDP